MNFNGIHIGRYFISILGLFIVFLLNGQSAYLMNSAHEPARNMIKSDNNSLVVEYVFNGVKITERIAEGTKYQFAHIDGFEQMTDIGKPALPSHTDIIAIPKGEKVNIEILEAKYQEFTDYLIHPALAPASDEVGAPEPSFVIDRKQYEKDQFYPANQVSLTDIQKIRELPVAMIGIRPIQFNPVTKKLRVYTRIKYKIMFLGTKNNVSDFISRSSEKFIEYGTNSILNNNILKDTRSRRTSASTNINYIIIIN